MELKEILHYYLGQKVRLTHKKLFPPHSGNWDILQPFMLLGDDYHFQLALRRLEDMTEEELTILLQKMLPENMEDRPSIDEYSLEIFNGEGELFKDLEVAIGANYTCRCFSGQITVRHDGTIDMYDEEGDRDCLANMPIMIHYLIQRGFDLFGLCDSGAAIDAKTLTTK